MNTINETNKKVLNEVFKKYVNSELTIKPYFQSMKDISLWLQEKEK